MKRLINKVKQKFSPQIKPVCCLCKHLKIQREFYCKKLQMPLSRHSIITPCVCLRFELNPKFLK
jgi:hypothetical protein